MKRRFPGYRCFKQVDIRRVAAGGGFKRLSKKRSPRFARSIKRSASEKHGFAAYHRRSRFCVAAALNKQKIRRIAAGGARSSNI